MNEYDKKYMSKRIEFNSANETEALMEKQRLGILAENSDRISAIPRNEAINSVADFVKEVRSVANRVTIPDFVPLLGDIGVGDLFIGQAPEEIENIAYGNMPFETTPMGDRIPRLKRNRKESFADAALLGVDATAVGVPVGKAAARGLKKGIEKTGEFVQDNKEVLKPTGSINLSGSDSTKPAVERTTDDFGFYSKALDETQKLKQEKGTGQQFKQMLVKSGVKQEEIDWLGLEDVFKQKKITKDDIVKHINDNRIKLREVVARGESEVNMEFGEGVELTPAQTYGDNYIEERAGELMDEVDTSQNEVYGTTLDYDTAVKMAEEEYYDNPVMKYVDSKTGYTITGNDDIGYSIFETESESSSWQNAFATSDGRKRYDMRRDESGNFEIYSFDEAEVQARGLAERNGDLGMEGDTRWSDYVEPDGENYQELRFQLDDDEVKFTEGVHFSDDENNLFHIRTTDRDYNGNKVLYVEELQSDWGQTGRDSGFQPTAKELEKIETKEKVLLDEYEKLINTFTIKQGDKQIPFYDWLASKLNNNQGTEGQQRINFAGSLRDQLKENINFGGFIFKDGISLDRALIDKGNNFKMQEAETKITEDFEKLNSLYEQINANNSLKFRNIERSPFVTSTDKWTQLAIKRLLSKAVDEGYDYVSFSPGDVHYDRWNKEGLITYYDYIVPKNAEKVLKQIDKNAISYIERIDLGLDANTIQSNNSMAIAKVKEKNKIPDKYFDSLYYLVGGGQEQRIGAFTIKLTPQVKDKVTKGQSMFEGATPAVAVGAAAVGMSEDNDGRE